MTSEPSLTRRVTRLENDVESVDELITEIRSVQDEHSRRFEQVEATLGEVVRRLPEPR
ncbi:MULTISPECIES: hypothetical protein [unclassified Nocardioides]|uniref:hypothetical protein n=1 Tax=unclassified Nocardioides TaxID=2615069 RepID=UPI003014CEA8